MNLENSTYMQDKFRKFVPKKALNEGWHYIELFESDTVVAIRVNISKCYVVCEKGGQPIINPVTKTPVLEWVGEAVESKVLSKKEYEQIIESKFEAE